MKKPILMAAASLASLAALTGAAGAATLVVSSYDMPNGDGQAHSGSYNYWDRFYSGAGATTTDGAPLSGGTGDLTDGVVAGDFWFNVENGAGTGPYVGWRGDVGVSNPLVTFNFGGPVTINTINIHMDNSLSGGVGSPAAIWVDGVAQSFTGPANGTIGWASITGLNLTGSSHTVQFFQDQSFVWTFISEVQFEGTGAVPEPGSWAMLIAGLGLVGFTMRRSRVRVAFA